MTIDHYPPTTNPQGAWDSGPYITIPQARTAPPGRARRPNLKIICKKFHYMRAYDRLTSWRLMICQRD